MIRVRVGEDDLREGRRIDTEESQVRRQTDDEDFEPRTHTPLERKPHFPSGVNVRSKCGLRRYYGAAADGGLFKVLSRSAKVAGRYLQGPTFLLQTPSDTRRLPPFL